MKLIDISSAVVNKFQFSYKDKNILRNSGFNDLLNQHVLYRKAFSSPGISVKLKFYFFLIIWKHLK